MYNMNSNKLISDLFNTLHSCPEASMQEVRTKTHIIEFLQKHTTLKIHDEGSWFYALHYEGNGLENVAYRADMDAIINTSGKLFHGCGHDGHCATLCRLALDTEGENLNKNVFFIFQPGEENGSGAAIISPRLQGMGISRIYGFHNLPGKEANRVLLRSGTFACASKGMHICFYGEQSHAAYPENGKNPAFAIAEILAGWSSITSPELYKGLVLATVIHMSVGKEGAFGVSAGRGNLSLTIRAESESELALLEGRIKALTQSVCDKHKIGFDIEFFDEFSATINSDAQFRHALSRFNEADIDYEILSEPMRWSEDFGNYLKVTDGLFMGIGAGTSCADLHTGDYKYNTEIIAHSAKVLRTLL